MTAEIAMKSRYVHNTKQRFDFYTFVKDTYIDAKLSDPEFAKLASARLGFECTANQVFGARKDFKIAASVISSNVNQAGMNGTATQRLAKIELWLQKNWPGWDA
jgi:hypothetical protein